MTTESLRTQEMSSLACGLRRQINLPHWIKIAGASDGAHLPFIPSGRIAKELGYAPNIALAIWVLCSSWTLSKHKNKLQIPRQKPFRLT